MVKIKNKFTKKALAFASAFIILCSVLIFPCLAQAPEITTNNNQNLVYYNVLVFDDLGLSQDDNVIAYFHIRVTQGNEIRLFSIDCVLTDYYYSEFYSYDFDIYLSGNYDISISTKQYGFFGGAGGFYSDSAIVNSLNEFTTNNYSNAGETIILLDSTVLSNSISASINNQFTYWENQIDNALLSGYDQGYEVGQNDGKSIGYSNGYTQAVKDMDSFERGLYDIFNAPFVFVKNISTFEIFGVNLLWILSCILLICLGFILIKFIGGALPL